MGAMNCSRKDCDKPMCDIHISEVGYICYDCRTEFEETLEEGIELTQGEFISKLEIFMNTTKDEYGKDKLTVNEFFGKYSRYE